MRRSERLRARWPTLVGGLSFCAVVFAAGARHIPAHLVHCPDAFIARAGWLPGELRVPDNWRDAPHGPDGDLRPFLAEKAVQIGSTPASTSDGELTLVTPETCGQQRFALRFQGPPPPGRGKASTLRLQYLADRSLYIIRDAFDAPRTEELAMLVLWRHPGEGRRFRSTEARLRVSVAAGVTLFTLASIVRAVQLRAHAGRPFLAWLLTACAGALAVCIALVARV